MNTHLYAWSPSDKRWCLVRDLAEQNIHSYRKVLKSCGYCTCLVKKDKLCASVKMV